MRAYVPIVSLGLVLCAVEPLVAQPTEEPTFEFRWTSGNMLELVTTTKEAKTIKVKICEYPDLDESEVVKFADLKSLKITSTSWFFKYHSAAILIYREEDDAPALERIPWDSVVFPGRPPSVVKWKTERGDTDSCPFKLDQRFHLMGWDTMKFRRLHVVVQDSLDIVSRDTVSRLTIERKYRNGRIVSLLEDETGRSLGESDDEVRIFRDTSTVPSLFVRTDQNTAQPADSISVRAILPKEAVFEVVREDPKVKYAETPWIPTKSGPLGCAEPFQIPRDFRIIERGGRMRVKYKISDTSPEEHQDVIAMDRHRLGIEMGTIFNANSDGTPIGKLEYSIFSESIWTRWLVANVGIRSTHMRVPSQFDSTLNKDVVKIAPVVEGEMTARASPCWKSDFDPRSVSFVAGIFGKTGPLDDSTDIRFYAGGGLGVAFAVPAYNERRSAKDFGRAAGFISLMGAYDSFWKEPARFRVRTDFRLDIFDIGTDAVTISLKGRLDFPVAHSAPIDVRLGISGSIDVSTLPGLIK